jgi:hypothetical protein
MVIVLKSDDLRIRTCRAVKTDGGGDLEFRWGSHPSLQDAFERIIYDKDIIWGIRRGRGYLDCAYGVIDVEYAL